MKALFVAWRPPMPAPVGWRPVGKLEQEGEVFRFSYTRGAAKEGFQAFPQMEDIGRVYLSKSLFPLFANRLLSPSRPEYENYLQWSGLRSEDHPDPIVLLGVTEGIRETDAIEVFPCPEPNADGCYTNKFFVHGVRWLPDVVVQRIAQLQPGESLKPMLDFQNESDPHAVAIRTESERMQIGYVPRYLARDLQKLAAECGTKSLELKVERINQDAPLQNRVLCRMRACWPQGFRPCDGEEFLPLSQELETPMLANSSANE